jgi:heat shock protein HslJ
MMKRFAVLILFSSALISACDGSPNAPTQIVGDTWELLTIQQGNSAPVTVADRSNYTLRLTSEGRAEIQADCNRCSGTYTLDGSDLSFGALACTRAFCGDDSFDNEFLAGLGDTATFRATGSQLITTGNDFTLRFVD